MRVPLWVSFAVVAACGSSSRAPNAPSFKSGALVRISDGGQIFDGLNTTTCVKWPSPDVKKRAGRDGWRGFHPDTGNEGKVLASLRHCDGRTQVLLVEIGGYVVPVTSKGVEAVKPVEGVVSAPEYLEAFGGIGEGGSSYGFGIGAASGSFSVGDSVRIDDTGGLYSTINQVDCLTWPSADAKTRGGQDGWGSYYPSAGEIGFVVGISPHCDTGVEVLILDVNGYIVPIGSTSVSIY
jgi:hypothetical protein